MTDPDPIEALRGLLENAGSSGDLTMPDGQKVSVESRPEEGILARFTVDGMTTTQFAPSAEPHATYPRDVPFVPDALAAVARTDEGRLSVHWFQPGAHVLEHLLAEEQANGWTVRSDEEPTFPTAGLPPGMAGVAGGASMGRHVVLEKDGRHRVIMGSAVVVMLLDDVDPGRL